MDVKARNEIFNHIENESYRLHTAIMNIAVDLYANKADAVIKYPKLNEIAACSMHAEDIVAEHLGLKHTRRAEGDRIVQIILP